MANKTLVVVESPAKAKTINKYLGRNYLVEASVGHIKDLVTFKLGVDIENDFTPKYVTIRGKAEIIKNLKKLAKNSKQVLLATDPDREGEAIAWHIAEEIRKNNENIKRVIFNEITKSGIEKGLKELRELDQNLFMSQQARRVLDRLIGFQVSPFLSRALIRKTSQALSAGRVQSVALRLICEREEHIKEFVPIEYWNIYGTFEKDNDIFKARLIYFDGKFIKNPEGSAKVNNEILQNEIDKKLAQLHFISNKKQVDDLVNRIKQENFILKTITKKLNIRKPLPPFTTSSLQQEAAKRLGFSNKKTMNIAQKLYEGVSLGEEGSVGLITYMRTDSFRLSPESQQAARQYIKEQFGDEYLPQNIPIYTIKSKSVQDAHEAIRPTILDYHPKKVEKYLDKDSAKLYELIYNRFLASQMSPAEYDNTVIEITGGDFIFKATGSILKFKGFLAAYDDIDENEDDSANNNKNLNGHNEPNDYSKDKLLPQNLKENDKLNLINVETIQSQTKPLPRYNQATLVKELDEKGIGRPSTYATIVSTLLERNYVDLVNKSFIPTELGIEVNRVLIHNFDNLFNVDFTAEMEDDLDKIATGEKTYLQLLKEFYEPFIKTLKHAEEHGNIEDIICEECGAPMLIKVSRKGRFLGCSNYPKCTNTKPLPKNGEQKQKEPIIAEGVTCDLCGSPMFIRESKYGKFYGCSKYPECSGIKPYTTGIICPKCKIGIVIERYSPKSKKKFYGCSRYPECDYISKYEPVNRNCPSCGHYYMEIHYKKDKDEWIKYLICPECKETIDFEDNL